VVLLIPHSEHFSDDGFTDAGAVDVNCGNAIDSKVEVWFADFDEQTYYTEYDAIFEGKTAAEVCREKDASNRTGGLVLLIGGLAWFVGALVMRSRSAAVAPGFTVPVVGGGSVADPAPTSPAQWSKDPFGRHEQRYWDGSAWTHSVSDGGQLGADPPVASPTTEAPPTVMNSAMLQGAPSLDVDDPDITLRRPVAPTVATPATATVRIEFDNGQAAVLSSPLVVGRNPTPLEWLPDAGLVFLEDDTKSVSKRHFAVGPDPAGAWVQDLGSSNGVEIVGVDGTILQVDADQRVLAVFGTTVLFGDRSMKVQRG
jgi:hypothetical protein